ncbi:hypothetical protein FRACA_840012 [Frankia canadensis]|uniref:J domain-containing protein n=2 Tax=Frankia canadensis TaxID=1836972 RepID=A0A2I2L1T0_9ACTN|nr:hypothetical protein FRACA_840012 [Frankia canadensis]SOU59164.1 hypothetical protein FRACA_840012 [Frankia canadensis]
MTTDQDFYLVLGVDPSASASQITRAYRTLIRRHHPDTRMPVRKTGQPISVRQADSSAVSGGPTR